MRSYVFLFFLPGAAGNFFSRCLALASDRFIGQMLPNADLPYLSLDTKFQLYQYPGAWNNWLEFERELVQYKDIFAHDQLAEGSIGIWAQHPRYQLLENSIAGPDDVVSIFYIDPSKAFDWCVMNALYKDSFISKDWFAQGLRMLHDDSIHKIDLVDILTSPETLLSAVDRVCQILEVEINSKSKEYIQQLWKQWICTTLPRHKIPEFKQNIGYFDT